MKFGIILFAMSILLQSAGQIMEKKGLGQLGAINSLAQYFNISTLAKILTNPYILAGIACSFIGLFCWLGALSQFKVSYLYAIGAVTFIIVPLLAIVILGESITMTRWVGIWIIVAGCVVVNL